MINIFHQLFFHLLMQNFEPKKVIVDNTIGVTTLLCHHHIPLFIYSAMSLFYQLGYSLPIYVVDDGSLTKSDKQLLQNFFTATIDSSQVCEKKMHILLKKYSDFSKYRFDPRTPNAKKKFDAYLLHPFSRFIYIDADILFYKKPTEIVSWIVSKNPVPLYTSYYDSHQESANNADTEVSFRKLLYKYLSINNMQIYFSSGLLCVPHQVVFEIRQLNQIFKLFFELSYSRMWLTEEHAASIIFAVSGALCLPSQKYYNMWLSQHYNRVPLQHVTSLHYAYETKKFFTRDAINLALQSNYFRFPK